MPAPTGAASAEQMPSSPVQAQPTEAKDAASEEHQSSRQALEHAQESRIEGAASEDYPQSGQAPEHAQGTQAEGAASEEHQQSTHDQDAQATEAEGAASEEHHSSRPALEKAQATAEGGAVEHLKQRSSDIPLRQRYKKIQMEREQRAARIQASSSSVGSAEPGAASTVVARMHYMTAAEMKWTMSFLHTAEVAAAVFLALILVAKLRGKDQWLATQRNLSIADAAVFLFLFLLLFGLFAAFAAHVQWASRHGRAWPQRQRRSAAILTVEALTQIANLGFVVAADVYLLARPCNVRSEVTFGLAFGNWTCWNTLFLILTVRAHNLNMWQDSDGAPRGDRADAVLLDAPWSVHAPKLILWASVEVMKAVQLLRMLHDGGIMSAPSCNKAFSGCRHNATYVALAGAIFAVFFAYFGLFFFYLGRAFRQLRAHNYRDFRVTNQTARLMLRTRVTSIFIFAAGFVIYYFVRMESCTAWTASASGYMPLHLVMTTKIGVLLYMHTPSNARGKDHVLRVWLEQFSWTEAAKPGKMEQRRQQLPADSAAGNAMHREPMFCFETAIKLYYFSHIIYYYEKLDGVLPECAACANNPVEHVGMNRERLSQTIDHLRPRLSHLNDISGPVPPPDRALEPPPFATHLSGGVSNRTVCPECCTEKDPATTPGGAAAAAAKLDSLDFALGLYKLEDLEMMWERRWDTVALVGWGPGRIVVVFRGTTTLKNVFADLQAWQRAYPPGRSGRLLGRLAVHNGFLKSYMANSFSERIVSKVVDVVRSHNWPSTQVFVTGHSLGGALANLAAYDIEKGLKLVDRKTTVSCYTFGAPRVGNYAFAHEYTANVPDTWSIINDQDAVARNAKFWLLYKRPGQRVLINDRGDMLVRPSFAELSMQQSPFLTSLSQHYLLSYRDSLAAVCSAQMNRKKRVQGGLAGVMVLLEGDEFVRGILEPAGLTLADVRNRNLISGKSPLQECPWTASRQLSRHCSSAVRPMSTVAEQPVSPFHEVELSPGLKLARSSAAPAEPAEEERADQPQPSMRRQHTKHTSNDFWWTALPKRVSSRPLGPQMTASLAGLPPRPAPPKQSAVSRQVQRLSRAFSGFAFLHGADSSHSDRHHSLGATASVLAGLAELLRGKTPTPLIAAAAAPAQEEEVHAADVQSAAPLRGVRFVGGERGFPGGSEGGFKPLSHEELAAKLGNMEAGLHVAAPRAKEQIAGI